MGPKKLNEEEKIAILKQCQRSQLSIETYAKEIGRAASTLYTWSALYKIPLRPPFVKNQVIEFKEITANIDDIPQSGISSMSAEKSTISSSFIKIHLPNRIWIEFANPSLPETVNFVKGLMSNVVIQC